MFRNYFKTAWRSISRNKAFSALNIAGLAISITAFILMALYIENELSFDRFNVNANNIYRVADDKKTPDMQYSSAQSAAPVAPALLHDFPEIKQAVRLTQTEGLVKYKDRLFEERKIFFSDDNIFKVFSFHLVKGNADNVLKEPSSVVLTKAVAAKYFGNEDAVGKLITIDNSVMKVTGVMENVPANSHLQFDFLISMSTAEQKGSGYDWLFTNWYSDNFFTYILLPVGYNVQKLQSRLNDFDKRHQETAGNTQHRYVLEKLTNIYLHSDRDNQVGKTGNLTNIYIFSITALFILLIACVNFINLSTARSLLKAKEVAVKKVAGASRQQMIIQFLIESFVVAGIALIVALVVTSLVLPYFNLFAGKSLSLGLLQPMHIAVVLLLLLVIGLLSGGYPAFVLSGFKPAIALKGKLNASVWSINLRKALVVFQFAISMILIVCSLVVYTQMNFLQQHNLGFSHAQTMVINFEGDHHVQQRMDVIKQQLLSVPGVKKITASSNVPGDGSGDTWSMDFAKKNGDTVHTELPIYLTDFDFLHQYNIPVVAGRGFAEEYAADTVTSMMINETALKKLGFLSANDAMGVTVGMYPNDAKIVGVFKDFNFQSLKKNIEPLAMRVMPFKYRLLSIEINTANVQQTVSAIENDWKKLVPERPLEYSFLDEAFNNQYEAEIKFGQVFGVFTVLAILIACFGLFGLALFSVQQRTKEIGVRKVLGASVASITTTLSKNFIALVVVAIFIASPVAWLFMNKWLQNFAYHISMNVWMIASAGCAAVIIAVITISFQSVKAAMANPVNSLRSE